MELIAESFLAEDSASDVRDAYRDRVERTSARSMVALEVALGWESETARHTDVHVAQKINIWRDVSSPVIETGLVGQPIGSSWQHAFAPGELVAPYAERDCLLVPSPRFNRRLRRGTYVEPRAGRFYPRGFIAGIRDIYPEDHTPFRLAAIEGEQLRGDLMEIGTIMTGEWLEASGEAGASIVTSFLGN